MTMKRLLLCILSLSLCLSLLACSSSAKQKEIDYIVSLLEEENYDMAIHVIEGLRDQASGLPEQPSAPQGPADPEGPGQQPDSAPSEGFSTDSQMSTPELVGPDMHFIMDLYNDSHDVLTLQRLEIWDERDGNPRELAAVWEGSSLHDLGLGDLVLEYQCGTGWEDWHPVVEGFTFRLYRFAFTDAQGEEVLMDFPFNLPAGASANGPAPAQEESWSFQILLENNTDAPLSLVGLEIHDLLNGAPAREPFIWDKSSLENIGLGGLVLQPGDELPWGDGHPVVDFFDFREYRFIFVGPDGKESVQSFPFDLNEMLTASDANIDYSEDTGYDLLTLRHDASFQVEVAPGVYWVNASSLGPSAYTNQEVFRMLSCSPEEKQNRIHVLYEALQLYQIGNFYASDDNIRIQEGNINWEHHKPGYHSVRTNTGCCASDSNWLNYLLGHHSEYEEVGFIATSQRDGNGHIFNYIYYGGYYYIIDLTHYRTDWIATAVESGDPNDFNRSDRTLGNILKVKTLQDYVNFVQDASIDPPGLMFRYTAEDCLAVDGVHSGNSITITYEDREGVSIEVLFDDPNDNLHFALATAPAYRPDYESHPDFPFPNS